MSEKDLGQLVLEDVQRQIQTIQEDIQTWIDLYDEEIEKIKALSPQSTQELASLKALSRLLQDFKQFSEGYHQFFQRVRVYAPSSKSKVNVLNIALGKILKEWATIQRAVEQRQTKYREYLKETDLVAADYYRAFRGAKASSAVVTYFEKVHDIARSLYSPIPIIGIPLSSYDATEGWLSIAHEIGHYIYWNYADLGDYREVQKNLGQAVTRELVIRHTKDLQDTDVFNLDAFAQYTEIVKICLNWLEEIFADTYGTLVAGPASALSIQRVLVGKVSRDDLLQDDGEHPIPYLRPFIHTQVLREIADKEEKEGNTPFATDLRDQANEFEEQWEAHWQEVVKEQKYLRSGQVSIEVSRLKKELSNIVKDFLRAEAIPYGEQKQCLLDLVDYYNGSEHEKVSEAQKRLLDKTASLEDLEAAAWAFVSASQMAQSKVTSETATPRQIRNLTRVKLESQLAQPLVVEEPKLAVAFSEVLAHVTETGDPAKQKERWERLLALDLSTNSEQIFQQCRKCGTWNSATATNCRKCGAKL